MMMEFWDQSCDILSIQPEKDDDNNPIIDNLGKVRKEQIIFATLLCRVDPVRYRSASDWSGDPGQAIEALFKATVYTEWPERDSNKWMTDNDQITSDMRIAIIDVDNDDDDLYEEVFNIVAPPNKIRDLNGDRHHLEIQIDRGQNV